MEDALKIIESMAANLPATDVPSWHYYEKAVFSAEWRSRLAEIEPFSRLERLWFFSGDGSGVSGHGAGAGAGWVVDKLVAGVTPRQILDEANRQLEANKICCWDVTGIRGLKVSKREQLAENIWLMPNAEVPPHFYADYIFSGWQPSMGFRGEHAALVQAFEWSPAYVPIDDRASINVEMEQISEAVQQRTAYVERLRRALILSGLGAIETSGTINIRLDGDLFLIGHGMRSGTSPHFVHVNEDVDITATRTNLDLLERFKRTEELELAVHRLGLARSGTDAVNRALDLGLALEIALMAGNQTETTEIKNKLGIRAAWLIGKTADERRSAYKLAGLVYGARSSAAHRGILTTAVQKTYNFNECNEFVQKVLINLLDRGDFPDWTDLSLGLDASTD